MIIEVKRHAFRETYTIGKMFLDGVYFCDTLEDKVRDKNNDGDLNDEGEKKVWGQTAIPKGSYKVIMNESKRFKRRMPLLLDVPHFKGIRIHAGNTAEHTHGCILVGENKVKGKVLNSKFWEKKLYDLLEKERSITIVIS